MSRPARFEPRDAANDPEWPQLSDWRVRLVVAVAIVASCAASALVPWGWAL